MGKQKSGIPHWRLALVLGLTLFAGDVKALDIIGDIIGDSGGQWWADNFADRKTKGGQSGTVAASNVNATRESAEPQHGGVTGGKSIWLSWRAPLNGIATFSTSGSSFDTVIAAYTGSSLGTLSPIASDDDGGGLLTSRVAFNTTMGTEYHIAIDGVNGASGNIQLNYNLDLSLLHLPIITSLTNGKTVSEGEPVTLAVEVDILGALFQWYRDGVAIPNATQSSMTIPNVQPTDVGVYRVRVAVATLEVLSHQIHVQISRSDDGSKKDFLALDKFADMVKQAKNRTRILNANGRSQRVALMNAPARGYSGTQIFSTYGSTTEPGEPSNCNVAGGASAWYSYQAQATGTLYITTDGSNFDTTLGVYTGDGSSFDTLTRVACDNDSGADGRCSAVRLPATAGTMYYLAVDGVNGASGQVVLNYNLGDPPVIVSQPVSQNVAPGGSTTLSVGVSGTTPCTYQWRFNGVPIPNQTQSSLSINNVQAANAGGYSVLVSNLVHSVLSTEAQLTVAQPLFAISGHIATWESGRAVSDVSCELHGTLQGLGLSNGSGDYSVNAEAGGTYELTALKNGDAQAADGITTLDIALMRQQVLGLSDWNSPHQLLAADVNQSGTITTLDIGLVRQLILGMRNSFPAGLWRFVPTVYIFNDPRNPWNAPNGRSYANLNSALSGQDFVAIKLGDVNSSVYGPSSLLPRPRPVATQSPGSAEMSPVRFEASSHNARAGSLVKAHLTVSGFQDVTSAQFALGWDPAVLRYIRAEDFPLPGLTDGSFGTSFLQEGILRVSWDDPAGHGISLVPGSVLFNLVFEVIGSTGSSSALAFRNSSLPTEATVALTPVQFETVDGQVTVTDLNPALSYRMDTAKGLFALSVPTRVGIRYFVEFTTSLWGTWTPVSTLDGDGTEMLIGYVGATHREGFYRVRIQ